MCRMCRHGSLRSDFPIAIRLNTTMSNKIISAAMPCAQAPDAQDVPLSRIAKAELHKHGCCCPCIFHTRKADGCWKGDSCNHCHLCTYKDCTSLSGPMAFFFSQESSPQKISREKRRTEEFKHLGRLSGLRQRTTSSPS